MRPSPFRFVLCRQRNHIKQCSNDNALLNMSYHGGFTSNRIFAPFRDSVLYPFNRKLFGQPGRLRAIF